MADLGQSERWRRVCKRWRLPMPHGWTLGVLELLEHASYVVKARRS